MSSSRSPEITSLVLKITNLPPDLRNEQIMPQLVEIIGSSKGFKKAIFKRTTNEYHVHIRFKNRTYINTANDRLTGKCIHGFKLNVQYSNDSKLKFLSMKTNLSIKSADYLLQGVSIKTEPESISSNKKRKRPQYMQCVNNNINNTISPIVTKKRKLNNINISSISSRLKHKDDPDIPPPLPPLPPDDSDFKDDDYDYRDDCDTDDLSDASNYSDLIIKINNHKRSKCKQIKHECRDCNEIFDSSAQFEYHFKKIHSDGWPYKCYYDQCGRCYTAKRNLQSHIRKDHHKERNFQCKICKLCFLTRSGCKNHCKRNKRIHNKR